MSPLFGWSEHSDRKDLLSCRLLSSLPGQGKVTVVGRGTASPYPGRLDDEPVTEEDNKAATEEGPSFLGAQVGRTLLSCRSESHLTK